MCKPTKPLSCSQLIQFCLNGKLYVTSLLLQGKKQKTVQTDFLPSQSITLTVTNTKLLGANSQIQISNFKLNKIVVLMLQE
ncbi:unnamed protein product [Trifolium pratense]|uniref:Uncharacterized protein n=1 Tax=Trifolium pratense TaxID=57577 RepID=A0ACB0LY60_TRIPR|nr:unnamed protein product [Trifolium pratense]